MGIYIKINTERGTATVRDRFRARIAFGGEVWKNFEGHFYPSDVEVWRYATLEALGGIRLKSLPLDPSTKRSSVMEAVDGIAKSLPFEDLFYSIILIKGIWHIDNRSIIGHISINNAPEWRKMYSDIEVDGETHVEGEDFADVTLRASDMGEVYVTQIVRNLSEFKETLARLSAVYFFDGPMTRAEIFNAKSVYYQSEQDYVADVYASYKAELDDKGEANRLSHLSPYKASFLVSALMSNAQFKEALESNLQRSQIVKVPGHSILFLGQKSDSFREAYDLLKKDVFDKLARSGGLRPAQRVAIDIDNALGKGPGQTSMDPEEDT